MSWDLFETPIKMGKVRKNIYWHQYRNGTINIEGMKYVMHSITSAKRTWCQANPKYKKHE